MPQQHRSLRVVYRHTEQSRIPDVPTQLQLQVVFQDLKAIADLISAEVNCNGRLQPEQPEQKGQPEQQEQPDSRNNGSNRTAGVL